MTKRVPRAEFQAILLETITAEKAGRHEGCGGQLLLLCTEGAWKLKCMRCGEVTLEETAP